MDWVGPDSGYVGVRFLGLGSGVFVVVGRAKSGGEQLLVELLIGPLHSLLQR
jgi:hypothetical protein